MKLDRIRIDRYGPFQTDLSLSDGIQLIQGPNESGKTLLTESLLEILTGTAPPDARVDEPVSGFVVASDETGEHRFDADHTLLDHYADHSDYEFTPGEFRNLFIIRDADLTIRDTSFYENVTDRITGLRTSEIRALKEEIRERGRLTPTLQLKDAQPHNKPNTQQSLASQLRKDVIEYLEQAEENELPTAERRLFDARRRKRTLQSEVDELETAREWREIQELRDTLASLRDHLTERQALPASNLVNPLKQQLDAVSGDAAEESELRDRKAQFRTVTLGSLGVSLLAFIVFVAVSGGIVSVIVPVLALLLAGYASSQWRAASSTLATLETERAELLNDAQEAGIAVDSLHELRTKLGDIERTRVNLEKEINQEHGALTTPLEIDAEETTTVVEQADEKLTEWERQLDDVDVEFSADKLSSKEQELQTIEQEVESLEAALTEHREQLDDFASRAGQLEFAYFTDDSLDLQLSSLEALELLTDRLEAFIDSIEHQAETARVTHEILEEMEAEEGQKVETLFGGESRAADLFETITANEYETVRYDADKGQVQVDHAVRGTLSPHELSKGTTDQLYFTIRVALAEQLLGGETGFFLMDDAFLASDPARLDRQVSLLEELAADGWQLLYLTAQEDAISRLESRSESDSIELPGL